MCQHTRSRQRERQATYPVPACDNALSAGYQVLLPIKFVKRCSDTCDISSHTPHSRAICHRVERVSTDTHMDRDFGIDRIRYRDSNDVVPPFISTLL